MSDKDKFTGQRPVSTIPDFGKPVSNKDMFIVKGIVNSTPAFGRHDRQVITIAGTQRGEDVVIHLAGLLPNTGDGKSFLLDGVFIGPKPEAFNRSILNGGTPQDTMKAPLNKNYDTIELKGVTLLNDATGAWVPDKNAVNADPESLNQIETAVNAFLKQRTKTMGVLHEPQAHEKFIPADVLEKARAAVAPGQPAAGIPHNSAQQSSMSDSRSR